MFYYLVNCEPGIYADDTHLTYAGSDEDNIQFHLNQDLEWCSQLAESKQTYSKYDESRIQVMLIGSKRRLSIISTIPNRNFY